jgi:hypothetical protein
MVIGLAPTPNCEVKICVGPFVELHLINILDKYKSWYRLSILAFQTLCIIFSRVANNIFELHTPQLAYKRNPIFLEIDSNGLVGGI